MTDFELDSYDFHLPTELVALRPAPDRHSSRLLVYDEAKDRVHHSTFAQIADFVPEQSTFVFNRSKVFPCRLFGQKPSGGSAELFVLSLETIAGNYPVLVRAGGKRKLGDRFVFGDLVARIEEVRGDGTFLASFSLPQQELMDFLETHGKIPIPPYIRGGESDDRDRESYQTVFAQEAGSVAAPTAGLHFSQELLGKLESEGHKLATVLLHVGAGTFAPVKTSNILEHRMHEELYSIDQENLRRINAASFRVAVGTTTLRTLESGWKQGRCEFEGSALASTSIFLYPGQPVNSIHALVTNFHLPKSSLLMLVSALIGREKTLAIYDLAIQEKYRFFSYGDGMLILRDLKKTPKLNHA